MPIFRTGGKEPIDCPRCGVALGEERFKRFGPDVIIDVCPSCKGTWYDKGEMAKVIDDLNLQTRLIDFPMSGEPSPISCPRCGGAMRVHIEGSVEVDACASCNGVWLDLGEEEALKAKLAWERHDESTRIDQEAALYTLMSGRTI
jgi:Zn-finger nucleic acid-binding protein